MDIIRAGGNGPRHEIKTHTFADSAGNGAVGTVAVFDITGVVLIEYIITECTTSLTEGGATATISLGTAGAVAAFASVQDAVDIDGDEFWYGNMVAPGGESSPVADEATPDGAAGDVRARNQVCNADIIFTVAVDAVDGGVVQVMCLWRPLSADGDLVAAA